MTNFPEYILDCKDEKRRSDYITEWERAHPEISPEKLAVIRDATMNGRTGDYADEKLFAMQVFDALRYVAATGADVEARQLWLDFTDRGCGFDRTAATEIWDTSPVYDGDLTYTYILESAKDCGWYRSDVAATSHQPKALDWDSFPEHPPEIPFVIPDWMPADTVTLFAAHGGTGKSFLALYISICLCIGRHPFTSAKIPRKRVVFYSAEDNLQVMRLRLSRYFSLLAIKPADVDGWLHILDGTESSNVLFAADERLSDGRTTPAYQWLGSQVRTFRADVLVFDNASDGFDGNENERSKVRQFVTCLKRLAPSVLLLAHVDAASSMASPDKAKGYSGSTGWNNSVRSRWFMAKEGETEDIILTLGKSNHAAGGSEVVVRWNDGHRVFDVVSARTGRLKVEVHRTALLKVLADAIDRGENISPSFNSPRNSLWSLIKTDPGLPRGVNAKGIHSELIAWSNLGLVAVEDYAGASRHASKRIVLTEKGREYLNYASEGTAGAKTAAELFEAG
jgi:hypothetical protein